MYTWSSWPRPSSLAMRSPRESMAADMADTRSSSTPAGSDDAMIKPSTDTTADASQSGVPACKSRKRSTICSVRDFGIEETPCETTNNRGRKEYTTGKKTSQTEHPNYRETGGDMV